MEGCLRVSRVQEEAILQLRYRHTCTSRTPRNGNVCAGRRNVACKVQQMVSRATALSPEVVVGILRQSNLGVEHCYLDPSPYNEAGAGYFVYGLPGAQQRALTMVGEQEVGWLGQAL